MSLLLFVFLMTIGLTLGQVQDGPEDTCPPSDLISPYCTCSKGCDLCPAMIECSDILNIEQLRAVFRNTPDWTFWHLNIVNSTFQYLPSDVIVEKRVR